MRQDIASDLSSSAQAFVASVWPVIRTRLGGTIEPVETVTTVSMARSLDIEAGIDFWHIRPGIGMRGIGSRVQWVDRAKLEPPDRISTIRSLHPTVPLSTPSWKTVVMEHGDGAKAN